MRILAIDYGEARIGLAISDADERIASPLATCTRQARERDAAYLRQVIAEEEVGRIVVGLPVHGDGREGEQAKKARAFGAWLAEVSGLPVAYWDERFSTVQAEKALWSAGLSHRRRRARRDRVAAQIFLQSYLEAGCPEHPGGGPLEG